LTLFDDHLVDSGWRDLEELLDIGVSRGGRFGKYTQ
jgi:hypothetical protein